MIDGILHLPWWGLILATLGLTHITIASVTLYLHRSQAHRAVDFHPLINHLFRFWLWLTTGMRTREWVAVHRKHHAKCETPEDPHSPHVVGIDTVLWRGAELYRKAAGDQAEVEKYGRGTPDDWLERHVYTRRSGAGILFMLGLDLLLFGVLGLTVWAIQMLWIPFFAAGVINGLGHYRGYRNFEVNDGSTNLTNFGVLIGGEEMHNNHHAYPGSARFSSQWWEFDLGWLYIRLLSALGLARVRRVAPRPLLLADKNKIDMETLRAVINSRLHIMAHYGKSVTAPVFREQFSRADQSYRRLLKQVRGSLTRHGEPMDIDAQRVLEEALRQNQALRTVYQYRVQLQQLWDRTYTSHEKLLQALQEWCRQAESTGVTVLEDFALRLRGYALQSS